MTAEFVAHNRNATSLLQWVWRSYFRAALIPLLLVEVVFITIYMAANHLATQENIATVREIAGDELRRIARREAVTIQKQLQAVAANALYSRSGRAGALCLFIRWGVLHDS